MNVPLLGLVSCVDKVPRLSAMACLDTRGLGIVLFHAMPRHTMPWTSAIPCLDTVPWSSAMACHAMPRHTGPRCLVQWHAMPRHTGPRTRAMACHA